VFRGEVHPASIGPCARRSSRVNSRRR
jgi:hypothetical protein